MRLSSAPHLRGCNTRAQVQVQPWPAAVGLQQCHDLAAAQLLGVLARDVDHQLQVGLGVDQQQLLQALQCPLLGQGAEVLDQGLKGEGEQEQVRESEGQERAGARLPTLGTSALAPKAPQLAGFNAQCVPRSKRS